MNRTIGGGFNSRRKIEQIQRAITRTNSKYTSPSVRTRKLKIDTGIGMAPQLKSLSITPAGGDYFNSKSAARVTNVNARNYQSY